MPIISFLSANYEAPYASGAVAPKTQLPASDVRFPCVANSTPLKPDYHDDTHYKFRSRKRSPIFLNIPSDRLTFSSQKRNLWDCRQKLYLAQQTEPGFSSSLYSHERSENTSTRSQPHRSSRPRTNEGTLRVNFQGPAFFSRSVKYIRFVVPKAGLARQSVPW